MATQIPRVIADLELQLSTAIAVGGTSFSISSSTDDDGEALPAGVYVFTIDSGTSNKEYVLGQLNGTSVTGVKTVSRQGVQTSGAARAHRVGATVILTNFAALQLVADTLRGATPLDGANPLTYDVAPTLSDGKELATVQYVLDTVSGGTVSFDSQVIAGNAGETVAAGELLYFDTADQEWKKTDADTAATVNGVQLGIALGSGSDGAGISGGIQIAGTYTTTGLTAGSTYYASNTAGAIATSAGTTSRVIGVALSTTKLLIIPRTPQDITDDQKAALAGAGATPSGSNAFLTEDDIDDNTIFLPPQVVTFTSSGTWTKDAGLKYVIVEVQAPGGGSSYVSDTNVTKNGGSGGGGGYCKKLILASELGATETITIGAVGTGGTGASSSGTAGGTTSFGSILSATGGAGGTTSIGGAGGTATGGDINIPGGSGTGPESSERTGSPVGGGSFLSATSALPDFGEAAVGKNYGGGSAAPLDGTNSNRNGAAGGAGIVIVTEYYS